jgi:hypothetical protein
MGEDAARDTSKAIEGGDSKYVPCPRDSISVAVLLRLVLVGGCT